MVLQVQNHLLNTKSDEESYESDQSGEEEHDESSSVYEPPVNTAFESSSDSQGDDGNDVGYVHNSDKDTALAIPSDVLESTDLVSEVDKQSRRARRRLQSLVSRCRMVLGALIFCYRMPLLTSNPF